MEGFLLDLDYIKEKNSTKARLFVKEKKGKCACLFLEFTPSFLVLPKQGKENEAQRQIEKLLEEKKFKIKKIRKVEKKLKGEEKTFLEISCFFPPDLQKVRDIVKKLEKKRGGPGTVIEEYEYSLSFAEMFFYKNKIYQPGWIKIEGNKISALQQKKLPSFNILAFDLEEVEENGEKKIIMVSFYGENFKKVITYKPSKYPSFVKVVQNEKELLEEFVKTITENDPDIILTYNGDAFDFLLLRERGNANRVKLAIGRDKSQFKFVKRGRQSAAKIVGRVHIDLFPFVNNILAQNLQTEVLTLNAVSAELLGDKKIDLDFQELLEAWRKKKDLAKLALYCLKDSELTFRLFKLLFPQIFELSRISGELLFDTTRMSYAQLVEAYLSKRASSENEIIPNQPKFEEILKRKRFTFAGGYVKEPIGGIHENIAVVDFRSLYPSIIATFNISPETLNCFCCKNNGFSVPQRNYWFCKKRKGFVSRVIKDLLEKRWKIKEEMKKLEKKSFEYKLLDTRQKVVKIIANATYGYFGFPGSKWYCRECAESAAAFGRDLIKKVIEEASKDFIVVYSDTDSAFLKPKEGKEKTFEKDVKTFLRKINKKLPGLIELDLQDFYQRGIFIPRGLVPGTAKKRYALLDKKGNLLIRGLETVRKDWCNLAKELQRKVLEFVLKENNVEKAKKFVKKTIEKLKKGKIGLKDLVIYEQLTKPIETYKTISPHVACAKKMREKGIIVEPGTLIMFVISKKGGSISEKAIPFEWAKLEDIDTDYYIHHQILPAAMRVLAVFNINEASLL